MNSYCAQEISVALIFPPASYIPIAVTQHNNICGGQIYTEASSASHEQEDELPTAVLVVLIDPADTIVMCGPAVNTAVFCANQGKLMMHQ